MLKESHPELSLKGKRVVLLLQGGGALGAHQVGAFKALNEACNSAGNKIAWVGGISIGAINAAVIAGPRSGDAGEELERLWEEILSPAFPPFDFNGFWQLLPLPFRCSRLAPLEPKYWNWIWESCGPVGQGNFFASRLFFPWTLQWLRPLVPDELANYDTSPLRSTLNGHIDWDAINRAECTWLSLGATRVTDGEVEFFNSFDSPRWGEKRVIGVEHVLASAALPPAFPPIRIDGELYWDGGVSSNTPIEAFSGELARGKEDTIVFLVDLWDRKGEVPQSMDEVMWREKSIRYGSRKRAAEWVVERHQDRAERAQWTRQAVPARLDVYQVMFERRPGDRAPQFSFSDADFSRTTFETMRGLGYEDMRRALQHPRPVLGLDGEYAALYRHGTYGKHRETDRAYAGGRSETTPAARSVFDS
jgi:NTE family protein